MFEVRHAPPFEIDEHNTCAFPSGGCCAFLGCSQEGVKSHGDFLRSQVSPQG